MTRVLLAGFTGLVGTAVAPLLRQRQADVQTIGRRHSDTFLSGTVNHVAEPALWPGLIRDARPDVAINCLGTTLKVAGSQAAFRAVDHDLVLAFARAAKDAGATQFISVSSVGAAPKSGSFYLRTKGEVEQALAALGFARLDILRPGLLMGARQGPPRPGEALAMRAAPLTDLLMHGPFRRYRSIAADSVARAIAALAGIGGTGTFLHEHDAIIRLAD
jgi:uncharacterized protein YbjT (DUF2867 family)